MKRVLIATCVAMAFAVSLAAQTPAAQDPPKGTPGQSASAEKTVTLKGCLKAGDSADTFVLADASSASETAGTAGSTATAAPAMKNETVRLIGAPAGMNLKAHVGHTVEITGMIVPQGDKSATPGTTKSPTAGAGSATGGAPTASANLKSLNVKNMKHVDAKCAS